MSLRSDNGDPSGDSSAPQRDGAEDEVHADAPPSPPGSEAQAGGAGNSGGARERLKAILRVPAMLALGAVLLVVGVELNRGGFEDMREMRQFERTPEVSPAAVLDGEVLVSGQALEAEGSVTAPDTETETLHYIYRVEEYDSEDGWRTVQTERESVPFLLEGDGAAVLVSARDPGIDFDIEETSQREADDRRYTEYRIDPGDDLLVFGYAEAVEDDRMGSSQANADGPVTTHRVHFDREGAYTALISSGSEAEQRHLLTLGSGLKVVLGVLALLFAVFCAVRALRVHQTAAYLTVATLVVVSALVYQGLMMMADDLEDAHNAAEGSVASGTEMIDDILEAGGVTWNGDLGDLGDLHGDRYAALSPADRERLQEIRMTMARSVERANANLSRIPERFVASFRGVSMLEPVALPEGDRERVEEVEAGYAPIRLDLPWGVGALLLGLFATLVLTRYGLKRISLKRTIENVPTSPVEGAVYGLTELKGRAEEGEETVPLTSPMTSSRCVYYRYKVQQRVKRKNRRTWKTLKDTAEQTPFYCRDDTGRMLVVPGGAECSAKRRIYRRRGNRRYYEWTIRPGDDIYVLGSAVVDPETYEDLRITGEDDETPFVVSSFRESELMQRKASSGFAFLNLGVAGTMMAGLGIAGTAISFSPMLYWTMAALVFGYLFVVLALLYYNDLVFLRDRVQRAWANIDVALKKRFDLVGSLAETVQGFVEHERELQERLARAREARETGNGADGSPDLEAERAASEKALGLVEDHPEVKSQEVVARMEAQLRAVENEIALMRNGCNDAVERYNLRIAHMPEVLVARFCRFEKIPFLNEK